MTYISNSFKFSQSHPISIIILLLISMLGISAPLFLHVYRIDKIQSLLLNLGFTLIGAYFLAGLFSCIWKKFNGNPVPLRSIFTEANKYFWVSIKVGFCLGIIWLVVAMIPSALHMHYFTDLAPQEYGKTSTANSLRSIGGFIVFAFFIYCFPYIYVFDHRKTSVIKKGFLFFTKNIPLSYQPLFMLTITFLTKGIITQMAVNFEYSSSTYWWIAIANNSVNYYLGLITFLTAAQVLHSHEKKIGIPEGQATANPYKAS